MLFLIFNSSFVLLSSIFRDVYCGVPKKRSFACTYLLRTRNDIDKLISVELPDPILCPKFYRAISSYMIHGLCGVCNYTAPCMKDCRCSKFFSKKIKSTTTIDDEGYPYYNRQDVGLFIQKYEAKLDNMSIVPYCHTLLMRYQGYENVEYCNKSNPIKYLFKYVNMVLIELLLKDMELKYLFLLSQEVWVCILNMF